MSPGCALDAGRRIIPRALSHPHTDSLRGSVEVGAVEVGAVLPENAIPAELFPGPRPMCLPLAAAPSSMDAVCSKLPAGPGPGPCERGATCWPTVRSSLPFLPGWPGTCSAKMMFLGDLQAFGARGGNQHDRT